MEAKSGQWIRNIYLKSIASHLDLSRTAFLVRLNSTFMVTVTEQPHPEWESTLHVYDLEAIRNPRSTGCLLTTITVRYWKHNDRYRLIAIIHKVPNLRFLQIAIDETQIVYTGGKLLEDAPQHLTVLDFLKSFP